MQRLYGLSIHIGEIVDGENRGTQTAFVAHLWLRETFCGGIHEGRYNALQEEKMNFVRGSSFFVLLSIVDVIFCETFSRPES